MLNNVKLDCERIIVVTNVINVIYNFDKKRVIYTVIYAEKVIFPFFSKKNKFFWNYFKKPKSIEHSMLQTWNIQSIRKPYFT